MTKYLSKSFILMSLFVLLLNGCDEGGSGSSNETPPPACQNDGDLCSANNLQNGVCKNNECINCNAENPCPSAYECSEDGFCTSDAPDVPIDNPDILSCIEQTRCNSLCLNIRNECLQGICDSNNLEWNNIALTDYQEQCKIDCANDTEISETYCSASPQENYCQNFESFFQDKRINTLQTFCEPENTPSPAPFDACEDSNIIEIRAEDFRNNVATFNIDTRTKENNLRSTCIRSSNAIVFKLDANTGTSGEYRIETKNISYDTVMTIHQGECGEIPNNAQCNDNILESRYASGFETFNLDFLSGSYFVTVYGVLEARGTAQLRIEKLVDPCEGLEDFNCEVACQQAFTCVEGYCEVNNLNPKESFIEEQINTCIDACNNDENDTKNFICNHYQQIEENTMLQCGGYINGLRAYYNLNTGDYCTSADPNCLEQSSCIDLCDSRYECIPNLCDSAERLTNQGAINSERNTCIEQCRDVESQLKEELCEENSCDEWISSADMAEETYCGNLIVDERCNEDDYCWGTAAYTFECIQSYCQNQGLSALIGNPLIEQALSTNVVTACEEAETPDEFNQLCRNHACNDLLEQVENGNGDEESELFSNLSELCSESVPVEATCFDDTVNFDCQQILFQIREAANRGCMNASDLFFSTGEIPDRPLNEELWEVFSVDFLSTCSLSDSDLAGDICYYARRLEPDEALSNFDLRSIMREYFNDSEGILTASHQWFLFLCPHPEDPDLDLDGFVCGENTRVSCSSIFNDRFGEDRLNRPAKRYCALSQQAIIANSYNTFREEQLEQCQTDGSDFQSNYCAALTPESTELDPYTEEVQRLLFESAEFCIEADFTCEVAENNEVTYRYGFVCENLLDGFEECAQADCEDRGWQIDQVMYDTRLRENINLCQMGDSEIIENFCQLISSTRLRAPMCFNDEFDENYINALVGTPEQYCIDPNAPVVSCEEFIVQEIEAPGMFMFDTSMIENSINATCSLDSENTAIFTFSENFPQGEYDFYTNADFDTVLSARFISCESIENQGDGACDDDREPENTNSFLTDSINIPQNVFFLIHGVDGAQGQGFFIIEPKEEVSEEEP